MKCNIKYKEISLYLDGFYDKEKREALKAHFAVCPLCKKSLKQAESLKASLCNLDAIKPSPGFDFEFNKKLDDAIAYHESKKPANVLRRKLSGLLERIIIPVPIPLKVAASLLLIISFSIAARGHYLNSLPFVEFSAGNVRIYRQSVNAWVIPKPNMRLQQGDKIELKGRSVINLTSKGRYKARIKDDSLIVLSKIDMGWRRVDTDFSVSRGKLLVNTTDKFKGSEMCIYTPACDAEIVGTAFMVDVSESTTWLGVLEGTVKVVSKPHPLKSGIEKPVETFVTAGQGVYTRQYAHTTTPKLLPSKQWQSLLELYQLVDDPQIMLLIGTGIGRVDDLLSKPAPVYISDSVKRIMPRQLLELIYDVSDAAKGKDPDNIAAKTRELMNVLSMHPNPLYDTEILMFAASNFYYAKDYESALNTLSRVTSDYPESEMASIAWSGMASIYQNDLKDAKMSKRIYADLVRSYPNSAEAIRAKEILSANR
jgi:hypothetical protein